MRLALLLALTLALASAADAQRAYPNPLAAGPLTVVHDAAPGPDGPALEVYNVLGRRVAVEPDLAAGVYLWRLRMPDGTRTAAQTLTKLTDGPLDVRLVGETTEAARLGAPRADAAAEREGCRVAAPAFAGFQHEGRRGSTLAPVGGGLGVSGGSTYAALLSCLQEVRGVSYAFPQGVSPFATGTDRFEAGATGSLASGFLDSVAVDLRTVNGQFADLRFGTAGQAARARKVYVLDFLPGGGVAFLDSAVVAPGTPVSRRVARLWGDEGPLELAGLAFSGRLERPGSAFLDSALVAVVAFRTADPDGVMIQIEGATVQGDAVAVAIAQVETAIPAVFAEAQMQTTDAQFGVEDMGFIAFGEETSTFAAAPPSRPAWLGMADPNGLYSADAGTMEIRCARGRSCSTYGVSAVGSLYSTSGAGTELVPSGPPLTASFRAGGLRTPNGRGLLFGPGAQFSTDAVYVVEDPSGIATTGSVRVVAGTPGSRSLVVGVQDTGDAPTVTGGEVLYLRDDVVRRRFDLTPGVPVDLGLRVELTDAFIAFGTETSTLAPVAQLVFHFTDSVRTNSAVEVRLDLGDRTPLGYFTITMTNLTPWALDFVAAGAGTSPL